MRNRLSSRAGRSGGFTLIEVVLATVIAVGMLLIVLFFYQQAANLRSEVLQETERLSVIRLVMDRMTSELRSTRRHPAFAGAFVGESDFIRGRGRAVGSRRLRASAMVAHLLT